MMQIKEINKILIIRLSALGDTIHTLPLAYALRKKYPNVQLDWIVEDKASKFVINNPLINKVYELPRKKWKSNKNKFQNIKEFFKIISEIQKENYDVVIDTQQLLKSSLIMGLSKGKRKIALDGGREFSWLFANEIIKTTRKQFDINYHVVKRNLEIANYLECDVSKIKFVIPDFSNEISEEVKSTIKKIDSSKKTILIAPATTWDNKHWITQGWVDVINEFKNDYNIILTASDKEKHITEAIKHQVNDKNIIDLTGKTTLSDLTFIFNHCDLVISPDSGSAHIAWAQGKPKILTLFFATSKNRTAPFGEKYYSISSDIKCSPCMTKKCKNKLLKNECCNKINSKEIINIVKNVLQ